MDFYNLREDDQDDMMLCCEFKHDLVRSYPIPWIVNRIEKYRYAKYSMDRKMYYSKIPIDRKSYYSKISKEISFESELNQEWTCVGRCFPINRVIIRLRNAALEIAVRNRFRDIVEYILNAPNGEDGMDAIYFLCREGDLEGVKMLLDLGARFTMTPKYSRNGKIPRPKCTISPLMEAARQGHDEIVRLLLKKGDAPNFDVLRKVIVNNHVSTFWLLLYECDFYVYLDGCDRGGRSLLVWACIAKSPEFVRMLLAAGANINTWISLAKIIDFVHHYRTTKSKHKGKMREIHKILTDHGAICELPECEFR